MMLLIMCVITASASCMVYMSALIFSFNNNYGRSMADTNYQPYFSVLLLEPLLVIVN